MQHIHILGAPGSGVTTLGNALAGALQYTHFDTDDYHWITSDPESYRRRRNPDHRRALLTTDLDQTAQWVLSGSLCGWGDVFIPRFDAVIWCWLPVDIRLERIRAREIGRYGPRIDPGGDLHGVFVKFMDWAAQYDQPSNSLRSKTQELDWLDRLTCPVFRFETPVDVAEIRQTLKLF